MISCTLCISFIPNINLSPERIAGSWMALCLWKFCLQTSSSRPPKTASGEPFGAGLSSRAFGLSRLSCPVCASSRLSSQAYAKRPDWAAICSLKEQPANTQGTLFISGNNVRPTLTEYGSGSTYHSRKFRKQAPLLYRIVT